MAVSPGMGAAGRFMTSARTWFGIAFQAKVFKIFLILILISAVVVAIDQKDPWYAVKDLGERFLTPTLALQEFSQEKLAEGGIKIKQENQNVLKIIWSFLVDLWNILSSIWIILLWIGLLTGLLTAFWLHDTGKRPLAWSAAFVLFFVIQIIFIGFFRKDLDPMQPIIAVKDFGVLLWDFFKNGGINTFAQNKTQIANISSLS